MQELAHADPRQALRAAGLAPKRSWGQNFLCSERMVGRIVDAVSRVGAAEQPVLELGAGTGALTGPLHQAVGAVVAVERDRELAAVLRTRFAGMRGLWVHEADAGRIAVGDTLRALGLDGPARMAGNLPYQLASRILVHLAGQPEAVAGGVFMVQKEVGLRLAAAPGSRAFSLLSVLVQRAFAVEALFDVPATAFFPRPKVTSQVVCLRPLAAPFVEGEALVAAARLGFSARRRTLARALADRLAVARDEVAGLLTALDIDPMARAETLDLPAFARLGGALVHRGWLSPQAKRA